MEGARPSQWDQGAAHLGSHRPLISLPEMAHIPFMGCLKMGEGDPAASPVFC